MWAEYAAKPHRAVSLGRLRCYTSQEEFVKCYVCLFFFLGWEKVRDSRDEDQEPSERSTEWRGSRKGYGSSADFYCDSEGPEDFLGRRTKTHIQCNWGTKSSFKGIACSVSVALAYIVSRHFHLDPAAH